MVRRLFSSNYLWLFLFLVAGGCASLVLRYELLWDFANYHYYNPWAFLNDRWMYDIAPAGINTFFNPLLDIPLYLLIQNFNDYPNFIIFIQGLWSGAAAFMAFQLAKIFFGFNTWKGRVQTFLAVAIGVTSWPFFMQIGTSTNEMPIALMVMFSWWLLFKEITSEKSINAKSFFISGLVLGAAAGLKLTAATYCVSTGISLILCYKMFKPFPKLIGLFILGGIVGFLITNGFWMWRLWQTFENPVFPLLNNIFKSEWFDERSYRDDTYLPKDIWGYIFYPIYHAAAKFRTDGEVVADYRGIITYFIAFGYIINYLRTKSIKSSKLNIFLYVICFVSFLVWMISFSIFRYHIPISVLQGMIIVMAIFYFLTMRASLQQSLYISVCIIILYSLLSTPYYSDDWGKYKKYYSGSINIYSSVWPELQQDYSYIEKHPQFTKLIDMENISIPDNTLLQLYDMPSAALLPMLNINNTIRGVSMSIQGFNKEGETFDKTKWMEYKKEIVSSHKGNKIVLIAADAQIIAKNIYYQYAKHQGLECHLVINNIFDWILCVPPEQVKEIFKWRYQDQSSK